MNRNRKNRRTSSSVWPVVVGLAVVMAWSMIGVLGVEAVTVVAKGQSTNLEATYDEPTTNLDGSSLTDLADTHLTYDKGDGVEVECSRVPATAATGGGAILTMCSIPGNRGEEFDVTIRAYASDTSGNVSDPSVPVMKHIDLNPPGQVK